jgi:hypothetical protein
VHIDPAKAECRGVRHTLAALLCRGLLWLFAVFAAGEAQRPAEAALPRSAPPGIERLLQPVVLASWGEASVLCGALGAAALDDRLDSPGACDDAAAWLSLAAPPRALLSVAAVDRVDAPADRSPPGQPSARGPPLAQAG